MAAAYSFPNVDVSEIAAVLQTWGCFITENDLRQAGLKPEVVQMIYACAIQKLTGLTLPELEESAAKALAVIDEWQELIAPSARLHVLLYHATRVAVGAGIDDFSMMDLIDPTFARTHKILSAIINFGRFSEERLPFIERLQEQSIKANEEKAELEQRILDLKRKLADHKAQSKADEPICAQLAVENQTLSAKLRDLFEEQNALVQEADALKLDRDKLIARKAGIQGEISVAFDTKERTKQRIVQSPERIKRIITTMGESVIEERRNIAANESKARSLKLKLDALATADQDIRLAIDQLAALRDEQKTLDLSLEKLAKAQAELERHRVARNELLKQKERAVRRRANAEEKLEREQRYEDEQRAKSQATIAKLKREFEEMSLERRDNDLAVEETKQRATEIERKMTEHLRQNEEEMSRLLSEYWRLRHQTDVYMETLANKLGLDLESVSA